MPSSAVMNEMHADGSFDKIFKPYGHCVLPGPYKVTTGPIPTPDCPPQTQSACAGHDDDGVTVGYGSPR